MHSDHQAILITLRNQKSTPVTQEMGTICWKTRTFDTESFKIMMEAPCELSGNAENKTQQVLDLVSTACDAAMVRCKPSIGRKPVYWWNDHIADCRRRCHASRRRYQRARSNPQFQILQEEYKATRRELRKAIKMSKRQCWKELCEEVDEDPWGRPYRTVLNKLKSNSSRSPSSPVVMEKIVFTLFPEQEEVMHAGQWQVCDVPSVTAEELKDVCTSLQTRKAPGLDGIPNVALKVAMETRPNLFQEVFTSCLR